MDSAEARCKPKAKGRRGLLAISRLARRSASLALLWWLAVAFVLLFAACFDNSSLGGYDPFYDSGVYLESARMIRRGYPAYAAVFSSQPPLWLPLLRFSFFWFGESFLAGQLLMATASLITVAAVMMTVAQLQGRLSALLGAALLILAPVELTWSRTVIAEGPSIAFAAVAMASAARYSFIRRRIWLVLASIAITCSVLTKLFGLFTVPAILLLAMTRWARSPMLDWRTKLRGLTNDLIIIGTIVGGTVVALLLILDPTKVWDQAVRFHWRAAAVSQLTIADNWRMVLRIWQPAKFQWLILALPGLCVLGGWCGLAILTWFICTLTGLLLQRPLFMHHLLALAPVGAVAAAFGWGQLWSCSASRYRAAALSTRLLSTGGGAACLILAAFMGVELLNGARATENFLELSSAHGSRAEKLAADKLQSVTAPEDVVLTDAQGIAFLAHRDVPPGLTDTSFKRISAGYLSSRQVIDESERYHVRAALLWSGRLIQMPQVTAWIKQRFLRQESFGDNRSLWFSPR